MNSEDVEELLALWKDLPVALQLPIGIVMCLLAVCFVVSVVVSIYLGLSYHKYNKKENSVKMTGEKIARRVLDDNGLKTIQVKSSGSFLFGNSYSHYFKKVRLRRLTWKKDSVSSMAMAVQKSCLAILDKEQDPDMVTRIRMTPWIYVGPIACIPLILIGFVLDLFIFNGAGVTSVVCTILGLAGYLAAFIMALKVLKTEKKAQERAYQVVRESSLANEEEIRDMKVLFRLYNIEYINNMITALLELILRILMILAKLQSENSSN